MKKSFSTNRLLSIAAVFFFALASCNKDDDNGPGSISDIVLTDANLSTLAGAVDKAGLLETLDDTGPYTLFAPTNNGFTAAGVDPNAIDAEDLENILSYHVLIGALPSGSVPAGPNEPVEAANGDILFVTRNANGVFINGVQVVQADIAANNGIIHKLDNVLIPPSGNIVQTASLDTTFNYLVAAVLRASEGATNVLAVLSGSDILTVFTPTNNAFRAAGFATIADIEAADPDYLAAILTYHVISGRIFSSDLTNGATPATLNGETVTISLNGGAAVKGVGNATASNIVKANIVADNGVVHVIDQVLLP